jgi:predicted dehydrogenase
MKKDTINWGILAPGRIAHKFAHDLQLAPGARLHAVASRSLERAAAFASEHGASHVFGSYEDLLACPDLDVVYVASPHTGHCEHTVSCLENKIAVLCEKPFAMNLAEAQKMVNAARLNQIFCMEAIWTRFIPAFEEMLRLLREGAIGEVKMIRADFGFRANFPPEHRLFNLSLGGGSLLDVGIYPVYLATQLWGEPDAIAAGATFGETGADESCGMVLNYGNRLALLDSSIVLQTNTEAFLYGENGTIHVHPRFHQPKELSLLWYDKPAEHIALPYTGFGYYHEILEVNERLRQGKTESDKLPLDFSLKLTSILDHIREKAGIVYQA